MNQVGHIGEYYIEPWLDMSKTSKIVLRLMILNEHLTNIDEWLYADIYIYKYHTIIDYVIFITIPSLVIDRQTKDCCVPIRKIQVQVISDNKIRIEGSSKTNKLIKTESENKVLSIYNNN